MLMHLLSKFSIVSSFILFLRIKKEICYPISNIHCCNKKSINQILTIVFELLNLCDSIYFHFDCAIKTMFTLDLPRVVKLDRERVKMNTRNVSFRYEERTASDTSKL